MNLTEKQRKTIAEIERDRDAEIEGLEKQYKERGLNFDNPRHSWDIQALNQFYQQKQEIMKLACERMESVVNKKPSKSYKELGVMRNEYGILIYTLYKSGIISEEQLSQLNNMPRQHSDVDIAFDIIDEAFSNATEV